MRLRSLAFLVVVLVLGPTDARRAYAQEPTVKLYGESAPGFVRLAWELSEWPGSLAGFQVRKRHVGRGDQGVGEWLDVHEQPILPGMGITKDLANVEPDPVRRDQLRADYRELLAAGRVQEVSEQRFKDTVRASPKVLEALRSEIFADYRRALFIGLGCIDRSVVPGEVFEYGLFAVDSGGDVGGEPLDTFTMALFSDDDDRLKASDLDVAERDLGTTVSWRFEEEKVQAWSVFGFDVYRAELGSREFENLAPGGVGGARVEDGWRYFTFIDASADETRRYVYQVAPRNVFGTELPARTSAEYAPSPPAPEIELTLERVVQTPEGEVVVGWSLDQDDARLVDGFRVERLDLPAGDFQAISERLDPAVREFRDTEPKADQEAFVYRVSAQVGESRRLSNMVTLVFLDLPVPPAPTGLGAEWTEIGDKHYIHLTWDPRAEDDAVTEGYVLLADNLREGSPERQASEPLIRGSEYYYEVTNVEPRFFTVAVAGAGRGGTIGPAIETQVYAPGKVVPRVTSLEVSQADEEGAPIVLRWSYPRGPGLAGFRVRVDDQAVADETTVGPEARSWEYHDSVAGEAYTFEVAAVSKRGKLSRPAWTLWRPPPEQEDEDTEKGDGDEEPETGGGGWIGFQPALAALLGAAALAELPGEEAPSEPEMKLPAPRVTRIRRMPHGQLEVRWRYDEAFEEILSHFEIEGWDEAGDRMAAAQLPPSARSFAESSRKVDGQSYTFVVKAVARDGRRGYSYLAKLVYRDRPVLPAPEGLRAVWRRVKDQAAVELTWEGDGAVLQSRGFIVYADDEEPGVMVEKSDPLEPLQKRRFFAELHNDGEREVSFVVAAIDKAGQEGEPATVSVPCPSAVVAAPASPRVSREGEGEPLVVEWTPGDESVLAGFRVYEHGLLLVGEDELDATARRWEDASLLAERTYRFEVQAVAATGVASPRAAAEPFDLELTGTDLAPPAPTGFVTAWEADAEGLLLKMRWDPPPPGVAVDGYRFEIAEAGSGRFERPGPDLIQGREHEHRPPDPSRAYDLRLLAVASGGAESDPVAGFVTAPAAFLVPARLLDYRLHRQADGTRVEWLWRYPELAVLVGFRIYQDGRLVADETTLGPSVRSWTTEPLDQERHYRFEIEAVARGGAVSARGAAQYYLHRQ